ncbi:MAG: DUF2169 domain-containing protein [Pseudomonadota bacterium]
MAFAVELANNTPFAAERVVMLDAEVREILLIAVSASFHAPEGDHRLVPTTDQRVMLADEHRGDPAASSLLYESDLSLVKPVPEVLVEGHAVAPGGDAVERLSVGLRIGRLQKVLEVTGDRRRDGMGLSQPRPFTTMPLIWERAWGGTTEDQTDGDPRNPVGVGYAGVGPADPTVQGDVPNITYPGEASERLDDTPRPAGFGSVGRAWQPRVALAGTYDDTWLAEQAPLPPKDFDPRHYQSAPSDQQDASIVPGAEVTVVNMTPSGRWEFRLPRLTAPVQLVRADGIEQRTLEPDTVILEPDRHRVTLKARLALQVPRDAPPLLAVALGHYSPVWLSARRKRKEYVDPGGGDGRLTGRAAWEP